MFLYTSTSQEALGLKKRNLSHDHDVCEEKATDLAVQCNLVQINFGTHHLFYSSLSLREQDLLI